MRALRALYVALRHPARAVGSPGLVRRLLLEPRIFDVVSCLLQLRDLRSLAKIRDSMPHDAFHAKVADYNAGGRNTEAFFHC